MRIPNTRRGDVRPRAISVRLWQAKRLTSESWRSCVDRSSDPPSRRSRVPEGFLINAQLLSAGGPHPARPKIIPKGPLRIDSNKSPPCKLPCGKAPTSCGAGFLAIFGRVWPRSHKPTNASGLPRGTLPELCNLTGFYGG
jgi:hypothetical protein